MLKHHMQPRAVLCFCCDCVVYVSSALALIAVDVCAEQLSGGHRAHRRTFMHLADAFIQSDLRCIQVTVLHLISSCFPWESNP